jgi:hypothetical protein
LQGVGGAQGMDVEQPHGRRLHPLDVADQVCPRGGQPSSRFRYRAPFIDFRLGPLSAEGTLLNLDASRLFATDRGDLNETLGQLGLLRVGIWLDLLSLQVRPMDSPSETQFRFLGGGFTFDVWNDDDLSDFVRLRFGHAFDDLYLDARGVDNQLAYTLIVALDVDATPDERDVHHLAFVSAFEAPLVFREDTASSADWATRFRTEASYEVALAVLGDRRLSLRASVRGEYRDDVEAAAAGWRAEAGLGLRFSSAAAAE